MNSSEQKDTLITYSHKPTTSLNKSEVNKQPVAPSSAAETDHKRTKLNYINTAMTSEPSSSTSSSTTRICIKNLPPSFNESKVKQHLHSNIPSLVLTDCKMLKTKDGRSRKIAFVGFKNSEVSCSDVFDATCILGILTSLYSEIFI